MEIRIQIYSSIHPKIRPELFDQPVTAAGGSVHASFHIDMEKLQTRKYCYPLSMFDILSHYPSTIFGGRGLIYDNTGLIRDDNKSNVSEF